MRYDSETTLRRFESRTTSLERFLADNFYAAGSDVLPHTPADFRDYPAFLHHINDYNLRKFAHSIHRIWKDLVREHRPIGKDSTFLPLPYPFVVPGGRFREFYYWDTFWIVEGLLVSGLVHTAKNVIRNLLYMVEKFGFVPNGTRTYFLNRSQPPMLTQMIVSYFDRTNDMEFLKQALPILDLEYKFWLEQRSVDITHPTSGEKHNLAIYSVVTDIPRPESWLEDIELTEHLSDEGKKNLFHQIASACETGWDFSSRWFADRTQMSTIQTSNVVPVDLNAILYKNEKNIAELYKLVGNKQKHDYYTNQAQARRAAIDAFMYNPEDGVWHDWDLKTHKQETEFYASAYVPLWAELYHGKNIGLMLQHMKKHGILSFAGGIPTTLRKIQQQWDFPNAWAPIQWFVVKGLQNIKANNQAYELARKWITSNYCGWVAKNSMFEKYNASRLGVPGGGGEYVVQEGFGWTNGVILSLLTEYGDSLNADERLCFASYGPVLSTTLLGVFFVLSVVALVLVCTKETLIQIPEGITNLKKSLLRSE